MRGTVVIARCSGSDQLNSTASTRTLKVRITHVVAAMNTGTPNPRSTARLVVPIAAAIAYSEPTCMSAMGRLSSRSRRIDPPTADSTPTKIAGTTGNPIARALVVPMAPNRPIVRASSAFTSGPMREISRSSSMPSRAAPVATIRYQLELSAAGTSESRTSRRIPPPKPVAMPMIATPSRSSRRSRNWAANRAPCAAPIPTASRSAQSGITKSGVTPQSCHVLIDAPPARRIRQTSHGRSRAAPACACPP